MLGHSSLEMTRHYCELADVDVKKAHIAASPVDNLMARPNSRRSIMRSGAFPKGKVQHSRNRK
jgi:hypothetical protein